MIEPENSGEIRRWLRRNCGALRSYRTGVKFRRQAPVGPYIADFYSPDLNLVVEVDGNTHAEEEAIEHDRLRDEFLRAQGLTVKRFTNRQVRLNLGSVLDDIFEMKT